MRLLLAHALCLSLWPALSRAQDRAHTAIDATAFVQTAERVLVQKAEGSTGELEWAPVGRLAPFQSPAGTYELQAGELHGKWPRRRVGVPVHVMVDGQKVQSRIVWFSVRQWKPALVYRRAGRAGENVHPLHIGVERMDVMNADVPDPPSTDWVHGLRLRRAVREGQLVLRSDFEPAPVVARNDEVQLDVQAGTVRLVTTAVAIEDGAIDEVIRVRPEGRTETVMARVTGKNEVKIEH